MKHVLWNEESLSIFDHKLPTLSAAEASNIIWENLAVQDFDILKNRLKVQIFIFLFLMLVLFSFTLIKRFVGDAIEVYPPGTNCASINNLY